MSIFEKFNEQVDLEGIKQDIQSTDTQSGEFEDVPVGKYEVEVAKMELVTTKSKPERPMLSIWFKVIAGQYEGQMLFYNQTMYSKTGEYAGMMTGFCNAMLESLESGLVIVFEDYVQYSELVVDVAMAIEDKYEYALNYTQNDQGFDDYKIEQVFTK